MHITPEAPAPLTIKEAVDWIERRTGVRKSYPTLFRWMEKGVGGRKLRFEVCGGTRHLMPEAIADFLAACGHPPVVTAPRAEKVKPQRPDASPERRRQIADNNTLLRQRLGRQRP